MLLKYFLRVLYLKQRLVRSKWNIWICVNFASNIKCRYTFNSVQPQNLPPVYTQQCHVDLIKQTPVLRRLWSHNSFSIEQMKGAWWSNSLNAEARGETSLSNLNNSTCWTLNNQPQRRGCYALSPPYNSPVLDMGRTYNDYYVIMRKCLLCLSDYFIVLLTSPITL
jgi:hypothetical protein